MRGKKYLIFLWIAIFLLFAGGGVSRAEQGVTKDLIKVGATADLSGPIAFMGKGMMDGVRLYFKYINELGGVNGRKLELLVEDDGYQSPRSVQGAKKLVSKEGVFCMVAVVGSTNSEAMYPFLAENKVPLVCPATANKSIAVPPKKYLFLADTDYSTQGKLGVEVIVEKWGVKKPKMAVIYQDDSPGHDWRNGVRIAAKHYGLDLLELPFKRGSVDFNSQISQCKMAGITHILMWTLVREPAMLMKEAQRAQYKATFVTSAASTAKKVIDLAGDSIDYSNGFWATSNARTVTDEDIPAIKLFRQNADKYKIGSKEDFYCLWGYQAAATFVEGVKRAGKNLTREGLVTALETFRKFDNGMLNPITWDKNRRAGGDAVMLYQAKNGDWRPIYGDWVYTKIKED